MSSPSPQRHFWIYRSALIVVIAAASLIFWSCGREEARSSTFGIVVHGGAGTILKSQMTPEKEQAYRAKLTEAITRGHEILKKGGSSLDAVEATLRILEDSPLFNAGKGAVFTAEGTNELDASIMDGRTLNAGAVAAVRHIRHPISLARLVLERSPHVLLTGAGAEAFAQQQGVQLVDPSYFFTEGRWKQLQKVRQSRGLPPLPDKSGDNVLVGDEGKHGTVGAVALDKAGNLAAATSTGGLTGKEFGRVGDSPIIGAGTYADNATCAVSATGDGEYFIRLDVAHDISSLMRYRHMSVEEAARLVIMDKLTKLGGTGGVIAIDRQGQIAMPFNTPGMYRGYALGENGTVTIAIYGDQTAGDVG